MLLSIKGMAAARSGDTWSVVRPQLIPVDQWFNDFVEHTKPMVLIIFSLPSASGRAGRGWRLLLS